MLADHPRIRGEHPEHRDRVDIFEGSSPHTRGALDLRPAVTTALGIIPAYAGSTTLVVSRDHLMPDHPRIRGEHSIVKPSLRGLTGSSPHTRGAQRAGISGALDRRIIPAYAGSTTTYYRNVRLRTDHPRIRGEHDPR